MGNSGAFELVTGHGAEPHVDADDHALLYASFIGSGVYRLIGVKTAEIEVTSENEVTISPGMFLIHGRFARVKDPISLSIETGSQGQNRNDLVVCEYSYSGNETEIDDMELVVVTGTPANPGSETDPSIEDDLTLFDIEYGGSITDETIIQVPLWRVPKEGLTTQDPVALFKDYVDATTARSSIDPLFQVRTLSTSASINANNGVNLSIDVPVIDGFTFVGVVGFNSSSWECCFASARPNGNTISASLFNSASSKMTPTIRLNALYIATP
jgi:hypothetical protein